MSMELNVSLTQKLALTQKMLLTLKVLQMSSLELENYLIQESLENPLVELDISHVRDVDSSKHFSHREDMPQTPLHQKKTGETLREVLSSQLIDADISPLAHQIAQYLIDTLDENGYLGIPKEQILGEIDCSDEVLEEALNALQRMEPAGVGASNLAECLLLQAKRLDLTCPILEELIEKHLDILPKTNLDKLASIMNVKVDELRRAKDQLLALNPKPGNGFSKNTDTPYVFPDLFVVFVDDKFQAIYNDFNSPKFEINHLYQSLIKTSDPETKVYLQEKLARAKDMISNINQRRNTVLNCARAILSRQENYFKHGAGHLEPMTLADIADDLGMHKSTISRAISGKFVQSERGVLPLSNFFSRNISEGKTHDMALAAIKQIIDNENPQKPLSDQKIAQELECLGIAISRRTVAKYRDLASIAAASGRKKY